jgi:C-terminal processing protease CtpA/Prc
MVEAPPGLDQIGELGLRFDSSDVLRIAEVEAAGPAARSGLRVDDVIVAIDGHRRDRLSVRGAYRLLMDRPRGARAELVVRGDGRERAVVIVSV